MRALLPEPADGVDVAAAYAYPTDRPWLRANMVSSIDGAVVVDGRSGGLSSPADKAVFAVLRNLCDAVLVGAGTARAEGYRAVTASEARVAWRRERGLRDVPPIVVVSRSLELAPTGPLFVGALARTVVVTTPAAARERGAAYAGVADLVVAPGPHGDDDTVDLAAAVDALYERGLRHLLCEGGPGLLAQVAAAGRLDELCLTVSPLLTAGRAGRILAGPPLEPALGLRLAGLLEETGSLFTRWVRPA